MKLLQTKLLSFNKKYPLRYLRLFYSGTLPSGTVEVKVADQWIKQAKFESANVGKDIKELAIDLQAEAQEAKITFAEREANSTLSLIEIDFWAEK